MDFELTIMIDAQDVTQLREMDQGVTVAAEGIPLMTFHQPQTQNRVTLGAVTLGPNGATEVYISQFGREAGRPISFNFTPEKPAISISYFEGNFSLA